MSRQGINKVLQSLQSHIINVDTDSTYTNKDAIRLKLHALRKQLTWVWVFFSDDENNHLNTVAAKVLPENGKTTVSRLNELQAAINNRLYEEFVSWDMVNNIFTKHKIVIQVLKENIATLPELDENVIPLIKKLHSKEWGWKSEAHIRNKKTFTRHIAKLISLRLEGKMADYSNYLKKITEDTLPYFDTLIKALKVKEDAKRKEVHEEKAILSNIDELREKELNWEITFEDYDDLIDTINESSIPPDIKEVFLNGLTYEQHVLDIKNQTVALSDFKRVLNSGLNSLKYAEPDEDGNINVSLHLPRENELVREMSYGLLDNIRPFIPESIFKTRYVWEWDIHITIPKTTIVDPDTGEAKIISAKENGARIFWAIMSVTQEQEDNMLAYYSDITMNNVLWVPGALLRTYFHIIKFYYTEANIWSYKWMKWVFNSILESDDSLELGAKASLAAIIWVAAGFTLYRVLRTTDSWSWYTDQLIAEFMNLEKQLHSIETDLWSDWETKKRRFTSKWAQQFWKVTEAMTGDILWESTDAVVRFADPLQRKLHLVYQANTHLRWIWQWIHAPMLKWTAHIHPWAYPKHLLDFPLLNRNPDWSALTARERISYWNPFFARNPVKQVLKFGMHKIWLAIKLQVALASIPAKFINLGVSSINPFKLKDTVLKEMLIASRIHSAKIEHIKNLLDASNKNNRVKAEVWKEIEKLYSVWLSRYNPFMKNQIRWWKIAKINTHIADILVEKQILENSNSVLNSFKELDKSAFSMSEAAERNKQIFWEYSYLIDNHPNIHDTVERQAIWHLREIWLTAPNASAFEEEASKLLSKIKIWNKALFEGDGNVTPTLIKKKYAILLWAQADLSVDKISSILSIIWELEEWVISEQQANKISNFLGNWSRSMTRREVIYWILLIVNGKGDIWPRTTFNIDTLAAFFHQHEGLDKINPEDFIKNKTFTNISETAKSDLWRAISSDVVTLDKFTPEELKAQEKPTLTTRMKNSVLTMKNESFRLQKKKNSFHKNFDTLSESNQAHDIYKRAILMYHLHHNGNEDLSKEIQAIGEEIREKNWALIEQTSKIEVPTWQDLMNDFNQKWYSEKSAILNKLGFSWRKITNFINNSTKRDISISMVEHLLQTNIDPIDDYVEKDKMIKAIWDLSNDYTPAQPIDSEWNSQKLNEKKTVRKSIADYAKSKLPADKWWKDSVFENSLTTSYDELKLRDQTLDDARRWRLQWLLEIEKLKAHADYKPLNIPPFSINENDTTHQRQTTYSTTAQKTIIKYEKAVAEITNDINYIKKNAKTISSSDLHKMKAQTHWVESEPKKWVELTDAVRELPKTAKNRVFKKMWITKRGKKSMVNNARKVTANRIIKRLSR